VPIKSPVVSRFFLSYLLFHYNLFVKGIFIKVCI
jgi:hypothetical protein